jgi:isopentenyldiphosphate isomerase
MGEYEGEIVPDPSEVNAFCYKSMDAIREELEADPGHYTAWFAIAFPLIKAHRKGI